MKTIVILLVFNSVSLFSQIDTITWDNSIQGDIFSKVQKDGYYILKKNNKKITEGNFTNNHMIGRWKCYHENGQLQSLIDWLPFQNISKYCGIYQEFYQSGKIKLEGRYEFPDSVECVNCFDLNNNKLITKAELNPSIKIGVWKEYWENGQLKSFGEYYKGVHQTEYYSLKPDSKPFGVFSSGGIADEYLKNKEWKYFNEKGELINVEYYLKGILISVKN